MAQFLTKGTKMRSMYACIRQLFQAVTDGALSLDKRNEWAKSAIAAILERKLDIDFNDGKNGTALTYAIQNGYTDIVIALFNAGADPKKANTVSTKKRPLEIAASEDYYEIAKALLEKIGQEEEKEALTKALAIAAARGSERMVQLLLGAGADWYKKTEESSPAINLAACYGNSGVVKVLLQQADWKTENKEILIDPILYAICKNHLDTLNTLLVSAAIWSKKEREEILVKPLLNAVVTGQKEMVNALLRVGADPNNINKYGLTPLAYAVNNKDVKTVIALLNAGANIDLLDASYKDACLLLVAKAQLPKPFPAEIYNKLFIENLGSVLLKQLPFRNETIKNMDKGIRYIIGAHFINSLGGNATVLPEGLSTYLSQQLLLEHEKGCLDCMSRFTNASSVSYLKDRDKNYADFAESYNPEVMTSIFTSRGTRNVKGYPIDYSFIGKALVRMDPELYRNLDRFEQTETMPSAIEYCLSVLVMLNKNNRVDIAPETPARKFERLSAEIKQEPENKAEIFYQMAEAQRDLAENSSSAETKILHYGNALKCCVLAKKNKYDPEKIKVLVKELVSARQQQLDKNSIKQSAAGAHTLFGDSTQFTASSSDSNQAASSLAPSLERRV